MRPKEKKDQRQSQKQRIEEIIYWTTLMVVPYRRHSFAIYICNIRKWNGKVMGRRIPKRNLKLSPSWIDVATHKCGTLKSRSVWWWMVAPYILTHLFYSLRWVIEFTNLVKTWPHNWPFSLSLSLVHKWWLKSSRVTTTFRVGGKHSNIHTHKHIDIQL